MLDHPSARCTLFYRGNERLLVDGILCVNVVEFIAGLRPGELASSRSPRQ